MQKEKTNQKRKTSYTKRNSKYFNGNFSATGCCKNCLKTQLFLIKVTTGACRPRTPCILLLKRIEYREVLLKILYEIRRLGIPAQLNKSCHSEASNVFCCKNIAMFRILPVYYQHVYSDHPKQ